MEFEYIIFVLVAAAIGSFVYKLIKHGGFKAAMFGARIQETLGQVSGSGSKLVKLNVKVHSLDGAPDKVVGLEFVAITAGSFQMSPVSLSVDEAKNLVSLIQEAANIEPST